MAREFPHISNTGFPDIDTVNAYKYQNNFDYAQYDKTQMTIHVCNVPWDVGLIHVGNAQIGGLGNVVKFESKEDRDIWFDELEGKYTWQTKYREYHTNGFIEVPLPYEKAILFNYVYVEYDRLPVDYADGGKDKFFFFIRQCESLAPNTCKIEILRDTWQTYIYDIDVTYMMLERGHAPMALTSASRFLQNPIENCNYLLADDVNYGRSYVSRRANEIVLNDGDMYACIVSSANLLSDFGSFDDNTASTPNGRHSQDGQPSLFAYALSPADMTLFFEAVEAQSPQFFQTIKAVFFVKQDLVAISAYIGFCGYQLGVMLQQTCFLDLLDLNTSVFGYGDDYKDIAKLYTYPYAYLEITDETGDVRQVRIEDTSGNVSLTVTTSLAYPWLAIDGRLSGIGAGAGEVTFSNLSEHSFSFDGSWYDHLHRWEIPTFAVNVAASTVYEVSHHYDVEQRLEAIDTAYNIAVLKATVAKEIADASANTSYANAVRSNATAKENADASALAAKENAERSAEAAKGSADRSAETEKGNANRTALAAKENAENIADTSHDNAYDNADAAQVNAYRSATAGKSNYDDQRMLQSKQVDMLVSDDYGTNVYSWNGYIGAQAYFNMEKASDDWDEDWAYNTYALAIELEQAAVTTALNTAAGVATNIGSGAIGGAVAGPGGAAAGAMGGLAASAVQIASAGASVPIMAGFSQDMYNVTSSVGENKTNNVQRYLSKTATAQKSLEVDKFNAETTWLGRCAERAELTAKASADLLETTAQGCADRNKDADYANAERTYTAATESATKTETTSKENAVATQAAANDNAANSYDTAISNNQNSYDTGETNADNTLQTALENNERAYNEALTIAESSKDLELEGVENARKQAALAAPTQYGEWSSGETSTTRPIGLFCNIVTQAQDAIEQAGDYFLRFGYAVNRNWRFTDFNVMPYFTYWKASDMWISGNNVPDAYLDEIRFFLLGGVCVWRRPEYIGNVSIYENIIT